MGANEPHAYIHGDCVECMALSDNVVRAGLTPKFRDVSTLCSMLTYNTGKPHLVEPFPLDEYTLVYRPPNTICSEFEVEIIKLPIGVDKYILPSINCASIVLVFKGSCLMNNLDNNKEILVSEGNIYFIEALSNIIISTTSTTTTTTTTTTTDVINNEITIIYISHVNLGKE